VASIWVIVSFSGVVDLLGGVKRRRCGAAAEEYDERREEGGITVLIVL
jgi:hypothetical protein